MAGAVASVAQLGQASRNGGHAAQNAFHPIGAIGAGRRRRWVQRQRLLCLPDQFRQVCLVAHRNAPLGQDDLGGALDELLRATDGEGGVISDGALDSFGRAAP